MATYPARPRRWTRPEYGRLIEVGVLRPGEPVELLGGELIVSEPQGSAHYTAIGLVEDALRVALGPGWLVRSQGPIALDDESEPEPDIAVTRGGRRDYSPQHPSPPPSDPASGLGPFAAFNQISPGTGIFGLSGGAVFPRPTVIERRVFGAPPPPVVVAPQPVVVYQTPAPVYYQTYVQYVPVQYVPVQHYVPAQPSWCPPGHAKHGCCGDEHWQHRRH